MSKNDMRRSAGAVAVLAVLAGLAGPGFAGTADADPAAARRLKGFEKFVDEQLLKYHVPGASVAIHHYDVFSFEFWMLGMGFLGTFQTGPDGEIASLSLPLEPEVKEIVFVRKANK